ncbi:MAG TPA: FHA domain-containing protein [Vicinamibacterales bacterium]|jgi:hypothetical protein
MGILDKVAKVEKRLERLASRSNIALQPIEIRKAALDHVEEQVQPAGRSRHVFPYDRVTIEVVAGDARQRASMEAVLGEDAGLAAAVEERLRMAGCPRPHGLDVQVKFVRRAGSDWETGHVFRVVCQKQERGATKVQVAAGPAHLSVVKGETTRRSYLLSGERTNIGRIADVVDKDRRVVRRNQVVFADSDSSINQTVSRAHAHITVTASGEYRLFDDRSSFGTRVFREGRTIALPSGSPRGTKLQSGDEIYIGQACLRFEIG